VSLQGKITNWKDDRGFGFITPNGGGELVFLHVSSLTNRQRRSRRGRSALPLVFAAGFLALLAAMVWLGRLPLAVLGLYAVDRTDRACCTVPDRS